MIVLFSVAIIRCSSRPLVRRRDDRVAQVFKLPELLIVVLLLCLRVVVEPLVHLPHCILDLLLLVPFHGVGHLAVDRVLDVVYVRLELVPGVDPLLDLAILLHELLCLAHHPVDLLLAMPAALVGDGDLLRLAGALVRRLHVQDAVHVHLERHLDLRRAPRSWCDSREIELAEEPVVLGHAPLALVDLDGHGGLLVLERREHLRLLRRHHRVPRDQLRHHTADRLQA
uniref:Uncharacterized protein n=1 Tax=Triticum urartu TaxID=4572 RepID=A0A8R7QHD6_TRIUA